MLIDIEKTVINEQNTNWDGSPYYLVDETTEEGQSLANKIRESYPYFDMVIENGQLVNIIPTERPSEPSIEEELDPIIEPTLEEEVAQLWYENMITKSKLNQNEEDVAELWYTIIMGGVVNV